MPTVTYRMAQDVTGCRPGRRLVHETLGFYDNRDGHRRGPDRAHCRDRLPEDPSDARQDERALGARRGGHARRHGPLRRDSARLSRRDPLPRHQRHRVGDDQLRGEGRYGLGRAAAHGPLQGRAGGVARLGALRPARPQPGQPDRQHRDHVHRQCRVERGLDRDQSARQGGALMKREQGFTLVEVIIAILVLTVGLLGLVTSAALVTRMIGRGQHSAVAAQYAQRRLEMLRITGCKAQASGTEVWTRGATPVASVSWHFTRWDLANQTAKHWQVVVRSTYQTALGKWRTDSTETELSCLF